MAKKRLLASGFPPWHSSFLIGMLLSLSISNMPSSESMDQMANIKTFTNRVLPNILSLRMLAIIRSLIALSIWFVTFNMIFVAEGWQQYTNYKPNSKLKNTIITLEGFKTLCPFTSVSWILLGLSFSINAMIAFQVDSGTEETIEPWVLRFALILWELSAPFSTLVSAVVRYAIWPVVLAGGKPHSLSAWRNQFMHNINSVYALSEMALLGGLPMEMRHISLPCMVGCFYVLFTWCSCRLHGANQPDDGPQYIYWFMDTTLGKASTIALLALLTVLCTSFATFLAVKHFVEWIEGNVFTRLFCVVIASSVLVRTRE